MKIITLLLATWLLYSAFSPKPAGEKVKELITKATIITDTVKPPLTGADRDMHGCIGSAGYTWSIIKKECIRLFEMGIRLNPAAAVANKTSSAFIIFDKYKLKAELFEPGHMASSIILENRKKNSQVWFNKVWNLAKTAKGLVLKKGGVVLYTE